MARTKKEKEVNEVIPQEKKSKIRLYWDEREREAWR